jgi:hypothetical protein
MSDTILLHGLRRLFMRDRIYNTLNLPELSGGKVPTANLPQAPVFRCRRDRDNQRPPYTRVP